MTDEEIRALATQAVNAWGGVEGDRKGHDALVAWIFSMFRPHIPKGQ